MKDLKPEESAEAIADILKVVLSKVNYEKAFIANLSKRVIQKAVVSLPYYPTAEALLDGCTAKSAQITEFSSA